MPTPTPACIKRLQQELKKFPENAPKTIAAAPSADNMTHWYFHAAGPEGTPYEGGEYIGKIEFPHDFPFRAPVVKFVTPSGRFQPQTSLCIAGVTAYHPEMWSPSLSVVSIVLSSMSFMAEEGSAVGTVNQSKSERQSLAKKSKDWNVKNFGAYKELFPEQHAKATGTWVEPPKEEPPKKAASERKETPMKRTTSAAAAKSSKDAEEDTTPSRGNTVRRQRSPEKPADDAKPKKPPMKISKAKMAMKKADE